jgi:hypothetical protein
VHLGSSEEEIEKNFKDCSNFDRGRRNNPVNISAGNVGQNSKSNSVLMDTKIGLSNDMGTKNKNQ